MEKVLRENMMMSKYTLKVLALVSMLIVIFAFAAAEESMAASKKNNSTPATNIIKVKATKSSTRKIWLKWNKIRDPKSGYAVFRDGKCIKRFDRETTRYTDTVKRGSQHYYQVKTWTGKSGKYKYLRESRPIMAWTNKKSIRVERLFVRCCGAIRPIDKLDDPSEQGYDIIGIKWTKTSVGNYSGYAVFKNDKCIGRFDRNTDCIVDKVQPSAGYTYGYFNYYVCLWKKSKGKYVYAKKSNIMNYFVGASDTDENGNEINTQETFIPASYRYFTDEEIEVMIKEYMSCWYVRTPMSPQPKGTKVSDYFEAKQSVVKACEKKYKQKEKEKKAEIKKEEKKRKEERDKQQLAEEKAEKIVEAINYAKTEDEVKAARTLYDEAEKNVKECISLAGRVYADGMSNLIIEDDPVTVPVNSRWDSGYEELKIKEFALLYTYAMKTGEKDAVEAALSKWDSIDDNYYGCSAYKMNQDAVEAEAYDNVWITDYGMISCWKAKIWKTRKGVMSVLHDNLLAMDA